jgi:hypothetical protein
MNFAYFFPVLFIGMWILVTYMISKMGWADLAKFYETNKTFRGNKVGLISASINGANYNSVLILKYNDEGIFLRPVFLFRLFHEPILIPWKDIIETRDKKTLFIEFKELIVGNPFVAIVKMKKSTFAKIEKAFVFHSPRK